MAVSQAAFMAAINAVPNWSCFTNLRDNSIVIKQYDKIVFHKVFWQLNEPVRANNITIVNGATVAEGNDDFFVTCLNPGS